MQPDSQRIIHNQINGKVCEGQMQKGQKICKKANHIKDDSKKPQRGNPMSNYRISDKFLDKSKSQFNNNNNNNRRVWSKLRYCIYSRISRSVYKSN